MEFPLEIIDQIRQLHGSAKIETQRRRTEAEEAARTERVWAEFEHYLKKGWPLHILEIVDKESPRFKQMRAENHSSIKEIENAYRIAKEEADRIFRRFPSFLEGAFREVAPAIDSSSRHPKYSIGGGFFQLEIDERKRLARLSDYEGRLAEIPADIEAIVETVQKEYNRIFSRNYNGQKFLKSLRTQYKAIIKKEKKPDGSSVPIRHITRRLGKNIKGFRTDEFLLDLSRLAQEGPFDIDGRRLDLQQTKDTKQGMLLHGAAGRGYIGFIVFKEV
jgi:hypothetical protein